MYELVFHKNAEKGLRNLRNRPALLKKVSIFFDELARNPLAVSAKKLLGEWEGCYSYRVSGIRIIYEIQKSRLVIFVLDVGPRGDVY